MLDHMNASHCGPDGDAGDGLAIAIDDGTIDLSRGSLIHHGEQIVLHPKAWAILSHLARHRGRVVSKSELMDVAWPGVYVTEDSLTQAIQEIRKSLGDDEQRLIRTISRRGYLFANRTDTLSQCCQRPVVTATGFRNETGDVSFQPIAASIWEDIVNGLARLGTLDVRTSDGRGSDYVIDGFLRQFGRSLSIHARLVEARSGRHIWGDRFVMNIGGPAPDMQSISKLITGRMAGHLEMDVAKRAALKPFLFQGSHEMMLRALSLLRTNDPSHFGAAVTLLENAAEREPDSGLILAHRAFAMVMKSGYGWSSRDDLAKCLAVAQEAIALSPGLAMAHRVIAIIQQYRREYDAAQRHMQSAVEINPCDADIIEQMGYLLTLRGKPLEGIAWIDRARQLTPSPPEWYEQDRGFALYLLGQYREAATAIETTPNPPVWMRAWLAASYAQMGDLETARRHARSISGDDPSLSALDYANRNGSAFEHASDYQHFAEGLYLALDLIEAPTP